MLLPLAYLSSLWLLAGLLRWLFRNRLPRRLKDRWIIITASVSAYVLAESYFYRDKTLTNHLPFLIISTMAALLTRWLYPILRAQAVNVVIFLILVVASVSFLYLRQESGTVGYYVLSIISGILLYMGFKSEARAGLAGDLRNPPFEWTGSRSQHASESTDLTISR
jgi:peptidoglycan/LPS O-acetylase OafA/YrhL